MNHKSLSLLLLLLTAVIVAACNSAESRKQPLAAAPQTPGQIDTAYADGIPRITIQEFESLKPGDVFVVDVRNQAAFDQGHIPGAKLIPVGEVATRIGEFPKDKKIVTYCSWPNEHTSAGAVGTLKAKGITNAVALLGGFEEWKRENKPIDKK